MEENPVLLHRRGVPAAPSSKEEKLARVQEIAAEILKLKNDSDVDIFFVDESHFSTEPYVVRGWYRKDEDFFPRDKIFLLGECRKK